jgi:hypothetical protein
MTEEELKKAVTSVLRGWCFEVEQIPEAITPTPDLLVSGDLRYAIEIKTKEDDPSEVSERQEALRVGRSLTSLLRSFPETRCPGS